MKLHYDTPMREFKILLDKAVAEKCSIMVNKAEMKQLITHAESATLFPAFTNDKKNRLMRFDQQIKELKKRASSPTVTQDELQNLWDQESRIDRQKRSLNDEIPSTVVTHNGITVQVALNV